MNRQQRRKRGQRESAQQSQQRRPRFDTDNLQLAQMRFDTPEASNLLLGLQYVDPRYQGSTDTATRLPPHDEPVSTTPHSGGMVYKAYPHGLMYGDQMALMEGLLLFLGIPVALLVYLLFNDSYREVMSSVTSASGTLLVGLLYVLMVAGIALGMVGFIAGLIGHRFHTSALLDRRAGKVHVFRDESRPWKGTRGKVLTYDWSQVRAEIDTMSVFTGTVGRTEAGLRGVVLDPTDPTKVIDRFPLTINASTSNVQPLLDAWEHARRFMQHEGPLFSDEHDGPNPALGRQTLWHHMWSFVGEQITDAPEYFRMAWRDRSFLAFMVGFTGLILVPFMPIFALFGLFPWVSSLLKREPKWPAEVLASVGGNALKGDDLVAWRGVVPERSALPPAAPPALR